MNKGLHNFSYLRNLFIFNNLPSFDGSKKFKMVPYRENAQIRCAIDAQWYEQFVNNQRTINEQSAKFT